MKYLKTFETFKLNEEKTEYRISAILSDGGVLPGETVFGEEEMESRVLEISDIGTKKIYVLNRKTGERKTY